VDGVSLSLPRRSTLGLVGESGSGKSTLARMVCRLLAPDEGDVLLEGRSLFRQADKNFLRSLPRRMQMIFQDPHSSLNPRLKIGGSIAEPLLRLGLSPKQRRERVEKLLTQVGLDAADAGRYPHEFSGGQRQRVAIARALAPRPELVVCDEPVSSLDASVQAQTLNLLQDLQDALGLSYLFISHDLAVVGHMSERAAVMYMGRIVESGETSSLFRRPLHPYTAMLLAASDATGPEDKNTPPPPGRAPARSCRKGAGCAYAPRCPEAMDACRRRTPELVPTASGLVRCFAAGKHP
jgi:peptide/nickel transport system ATP-binding protein